MPARDARGYVHVCALFFTVAQFDLVELVQDAEKSYNVVTNA